MLFLLPGMAFINSLEIFSPKPWFIKSFLQLFVSYVNNFASYNWLVIWNLDFLPFPHCCILYGTSFIAFHLSLQSVQVPYVYHIACSLIRYTGKSFSLFKSILYHSPEFFLVYINYRNKHILYSFLVARTDTVWLWYSHWIKYQKQATFLLRTSSSHHLRRSISLF